MLLLAPSALSLSLLFLLLRWIFIKFMFSISQRFSPNRRHYTAVANSSPEAVSRERERTLKLCEYSVMFTFILLCWKSIWSTSSVTSLTEATVTWEQRMSEVEIMEIFGIVKLTIQKVSSLRSTEIWAPFKTHTNDDDDGGVLDSRLYQCVSTSTRLCPDLCKG